MAVGGLARLNKSLGRLEARPVGKQPLGDQCFVDRYPGFSERRPITREALRARGLVGIADDESDAFVAQRQNMPGHRHRRGMIVDADRQQSGARPGACHGDGDRAGLRQHGVDAFRIAQRRRQHDAIDAGGEQFVDYCTSCCLVSHFSTTSCTWLSRACSKLPTKNSLR